MIPYYTQYLCSHVVDYLNRVQRTTVAMADLEQILRMILTSPPPNMLYAWEGLTRLQQITLAVLSEQCGDDHAFMRADRVAAGMVEQGSPLVLPAETLHGQMEQLAECEVLERDAEGQYRFRVDLFRRWIRHARSIWRLVEEPPPQPARWSWRVALGATLLIAAVVGIFLMRGLSDEEHLRQQRIGVEPMGPMTGDLWITSTASWGGRLD